MIEEKNIIVNTKALMNKTKASVVFKNISLDTLMKLSEIVAKESDLETDLEMEVETSTPIETKTETKPVKKRATKKAKAETVEVDESEDIEIEDDDKEDILTDFFDEGEKEDDSEESVYDQDDVMEALKTYAQSFGNVKTGRAEALKILKTLKVKSLDELEESEYNKAMTLITSKLKRR
jgi:hypothetical protein